MVTMFNKTYYIDLDRVMTACYVVNTPQEEYLEEEEDIEEEEEEEEDNEEYEETDTMQINVFKYEMIKMCIERVFNDFDSNEDNMIPTFSKESQSYKLAFATLIKNKILVEFDENDYE